MRVRRYRKSPTTASANHRIHERLYLRGEGRRFGRVGGAEQAVDLAVFQVVFWYTSARPSKPIALRANASACGMLAGPRWVEAASSMGGGALVMFAVGQHSSQNAGSSPNAMPNGSSGAGLPSPARRCSRRCRGRRSRRR